MSFVPTPELNTLYFTWINQYSGALIKTPTKTLLIDPVDVKPKDYPQIDALLITHEHYDHLDPSLVAAIQATSDCPVIADAASAKKLQNTLPPNKIQQAQPGYETKIGGVTIKAQKSQHPAKAPVTYIVTSEDNLKIYHTSDSHPFPELALMAQREQFDMVFCTVGIAPNATPQTGFEIAWLTKPPLVVPYHGSKQNQTKFAELIKRDLKKTQCLIPEKNKIYQIAKTK